MSTRSVAPRGTTSGVHIRLQTTSTSTWDLVTGIDAATQTDRDVGPSPHRSGDSDSDNSDDHEAVSWAGGTEVDERTSLKRPVLLSAGEEDTHAGEGLARSSDHSVCAGESRGEPAAPELVLLAAVERVVIIQHEGTIQNNYFVNTVHFNWRNADEEMAAERITIDQQRKEVQLKSLERSLKKDKKRLKKLMEEHRRQVLHNQAADSAQTERLNEMEERQQVINRKQQELEGHQHQMFQQVAKLSTDMEEARRKEREGKTYIFKLGEKHKGFLESVWVGLKERFVQFMKSLYKKFKIKITQIGVFCGMQFVMNIPPETADALAKQVVAIQKAILEEIIPQDLQAEVQWESTVPVLGEVELYPPVQVSEEQAQASADVASVEPLLTNEPTMSFEVRIPTEGNTCSVRSLVITGDNVLVLADYDNRKVMCSPLGSSPADAVIATRLDHRPWDLALYEQDVIAVASDTDVILLLKVGRDSIGPVRQVRTARKYMSVTSSAEGGTLVVGSKKDGGSRPAVVDVITGEGKVLWTVADGHTLPDLHWPRCLHLWKRQVLVSDGYDLIHRVDLTLHRPDPPLTHPDLKNPRQVTTDAAGNVFVTCSGTNCVLVHTVASGQWRSLLSGREQGDGGGQGSPLAVAVTDGGLMVVSWRRLHLRQTPVIGYDLKA